MNEYKRAILLAMQQKLQEEKEQERKNSVFVVHSML